MCTLHNINIINRANFLSKNLKDLSLMYLAVFMCELTTNSIALMQQMILPNQANDIFFFLKRTNE